MRAHGSRSTYVNRGCRCDPCREANRDYRRRKLGSPLARTPIVSQAWRADARHDEAQRLLPFPWEVDQ